MKIVIIDESPLLASSLKCLLKHEYDISEVNTYPTATVFKSTDMESATHADIIICDWLNGDTELLVASLKHTGTRIIILSHCRNVNLVRKAFHKGIAAFVDKNALNEELANAIKAVAEGGVYVDNNLANNMIVNMHSENDQAGRFYLTDREDEVLQLLCQGMSVKGVADILGLSHHTTLHFQRKLMKKMNVNRNSDIILFAIRNRLVYPGIIKVNAG